MTARAACPSLARLIAVQLDRATYEGYRVGFEAARAEALLLARRAAAPGLVAALEAMRPLPDARELRQ